MRTQLPLGLHETNPFAYHCRMALKWKRLIALLLLAFSATTLAASACAMTCVEAHQALASQTPPCHHQDSSYPSACPLSQLCGFATAPAVISDGPMMVVISAAYIPPSADPVGVGVDPAPPLKPPPA